MAIALESDRRPTGCSANRERSESAGFPAFEVGMPEIRVDHRGLTVFGVLPAGRSMDILTS